MTYATCRKCGLRFPMAVTPHVRTGPGTPASGGHGSITFSGITTRCRCGGLADMDDGTMSWRDDLQSLAFTATAEQRARLKEIVTALGPDASVEVLSREVASFWPALAHLLSQIYAHTDSKTILQVLTLLVAAWSAGVATKSAKVAEQVMETAAGQLQVAKEQLEVSRWKAERDVDLAERRFKFEQEQAGTPQTITETKREQKKVEKRRRRNDQASKSKRKNRR